ncbi:MAG TPA: hypothetical protein VFE25_10960 [Opitutaceae bacterium]|nr:hypothetical protein [Opitutaceae bacterium]
MRTGAICAAVVLLASAAPIARADDEVMDQVDEQLSFSTLNDQVRMHLSGTVDLEGYYVSQEDPALFETDAHTFVVPRLSLFLDVQIGAHLYGFVQARADDGFDPGDVGEKVRLDEYALRLSPWDDNRLSLQVGKFATVVGNWTLRHGSWDNPFITAPLPYENLTGIWDTDPVRSVEQLQFWAGVLPKPTAGNVFFEQYENIPIIWGPSYSSGAALLGVVGKIDYAVEVKNTSLSSRPETWSPSETQWQNPTFSGRVGYTPSATWNFGLSASAGPYLEPDPAAVLPPGIGLDRYMELVLGQDMTFAWHHLQIWAEAYEARFEIPQVGNADTAAYYVEARYRFTPQFFGAIRWNQQYFAPVQVPPGQDGFWSRNVNRLDIGPCYRLTPHSQIKVQYSIERQGADERVWSSLAAVQFTLRF